MEQTKPRQNYTGYGWEGKNYTEGLSTTEIAKLIRAEIKAKFPKIKASVTSKYYAGGSSIDVKIFMLPFNPMNPKFDPDQNGYYAEGRYVVEYVELDKAIQAIGDAYRYSDSDGMIDYFSTNFYYHVALDWQSEKEYQNANLEKAVRESFNA